MQTSLKSVKITARYAHKTNGKLNGIVTYAVRSSDGTTLYCTTLINGKASGCSCPSHKPCYHMKGLERKEAARTPVVVVKSESNESTTIQPISLPDGYCGSHKTLTCKGPELPKRDMMAANLTKQGFHLMR
ncbi:MAG: hypothetical protein AUF65_01055 [Chloroflexi bacterium 13_1_20CM_50_12]|nr:MAG: hypothetical protein AUF65_01055 [Chloroflexi bacterium 13_1_20CM_50_12]